jgi:hypothetical protein
LPVVLALAPAAVEARCAELPAPVDESQAPHRAGAWRQAAPS